jgi:hypothetical protein
MLDAQSRSWRRGAHRKGCGVDGLIKKTVSKAHQENSELDFTTCRCDFFGDNELHSHRCRLLSIILQMIDLGMNFVLLQSICSDLSDQCPTSLFTERHRFRQYDRLQIFLSRKY